MQILVFPFHTIDAEMFLLRGEVCLPLFIVSPTENGAA